MIDWAIEAWNDYEYALRRHLTSDEAIKEIEYAEDGKYIGGIGEQHSEYIKLAKILIEQVLNRGLVTRLQYIDTIRIFRMETFGQRRKMYLILPVYNYSTRQLEAKKNIVGYCYTTIDCDLHPDTMKYALAQSGNNRICWLMKIALTMVQNLRRMGDE